MRNDQVEMLQALLELRVIRREGRKLFAELEDAYGDLGQLRNKLASGNKSERQAAEKISKIFYDFSEAIYELQDLIEGN